MAEDWRAPRPSSARTRRPPPAPGASLAGAVVASGVMSWVGLLGGAIRHTEVRADPPPDFGVPAAPPAPVAAQGATGP